MFVDQAAGTAATRHTPHPGHDPVHSERKKKKHHHPPPPPPPPPVTNAPLIGVTSFGAENCAPGTPNGFAQLSAPIVHDFVTNALSNLPRVRRAGGLARAGRPRVTGWRRDFPRIPAAASGAGLICWRRGVARAEMLLLEGDGATASRYAAGMHPLRRLRTERQLSVRALAELAGVTPQTLLDLEHGRRQATFGTMRAVCAALGVPAEQITEFAATLHAREQLQRRAKPGDTPPPTTPPPIEPAQSSAHEPV